MGLLCEWDVSVWGFPKSTPYGTRTIDYSNAYKIFSDVVVKLAQTYVPVDTGYLRSTIKANGNDAGASASADAEYAEYVEYGTWKMAAQSYFVPAVEIAGQLAYQAAAEAYQFASNQEMCEMVAIMTQQRVQLTPQQFTYGTCPQIPSNAKYKGPVEGYDYTVLPTTITKRGHEFYPDGKETVRSIQASTPSMWRKGTTMYKIAQDRSSTTMLARQEAMAEYDNLREHQKKAKEFEDKMAKNNSSMLSPTATNVANVGMQLIQFDGSFADWISSTMMALAATALTGIILMILEAILGDIGEVAYHPLDIIIT